MRRVLAILACGFTVAGCASGSDALKSATPTTTLQFESEPAGAEVKTSTGQTCKTPCALAVPATDLMATYALKGFKSATVPVKLVPPTDTRAGSDSEGNTAPPLPTFSPSPVFAELEKAGPRAQTGAGPQAAARDHLIRRARACARFGRASQTAGTGRAGRQLLIALAACSQPADPGSLNASRRAKASQRRRKGVT